MDFWSFRNRKMFKGKGHLALITPRAERGRAMTHAHRLAVLLILAILVPSGTAFASSGGAAIAPPQNPRGFDNRAVVYTSFSRTLRRGETGQDVKTLQTWLSELGYRVRQNGHFGASTQRAVKQFQSAHGLSPA